MGKHELTGVCADRRQHGLPNLVGPGPLYATVRRFFFRLVRAFEPVIAALI